MSACWEKSGVSADALCALCKHDACCSSILNVNVQLLISFKHSSKLIKTVKCKPEIITLNNTNTLYVFNPIFLTNVFAADLQWFKSIILIHLILQYGSKPMGETSGSLATIEK